MVAVDAIPAFDVDLRQSAVGMSIFPAADLFHGLAWAHGSNERHAPDATFARPFGAVVDGENLTACAVRTLSVTVGFAKASALK